MKTRSIALLAPLLILVGGAAAQAQVPNSRPTVSPYLNLYRGGASATSNYYNLVRPEIDFRNSIQQLQTQSTANQQALSDLATPAGPLVTGHAAGFMTQRSYFQTQGSSGAGAGAAGFGTVGRAKASGSR